MAPEMRLDLGFFTDCSVAAASLAQVSWGKPVAGSGIARARGRHSRGHYLVLNAIASADPITDHKSHTESLIDLDAQWLPHQPARREAFLMFFRLWRQKVQPKFAQQATPEFLFLYIAVDQLVQDRDQLEARGLFAKTSNAQGEMREDQPAWKRYCDMLARAQTVLVAVPAFRSYSLFSELDQLKKKVSEAEHKYRGDTGKR
jgi:hypothetical protein